MFSWQQPAKLTVTISKRDHVLGPETARVTLVEYGDYQCPYCGQAYQVVKEITRQLGDSLCFVYRHFPLREIHHYSEQAAEAAEAAGAQGKFWEMHAQLFEHQNALDGSSLKQYASELGLDKSRFDRDLAIGAFAARVQEDYRSGLQSGVQGTPTFFINGLRHDGSWGFQTLMAAIKAAT